MKQYIVIGCGRFGSSLATTMNLLGHQVMAIDKNEEIQFNRLILDKPKWFNIRTYNYLEKKFKDYIQDLTSLS